MSHIFKSFKIYYNIKLLKFKNIYNGLKVLISFISYISLILINKAINSL